MAHNRAAYDEDFFAWTAEQARLLRAGEWSAIDAENLAEEIESMGRSDRRELKSRLTVLLAHLLKWRYQPQMRSTGWLGTIREQRRKIEDLLDESPSLRPYVTEIQPAAYPAAREDAAETGLAEAEFPVECPFTADEVLARSFLPEA